MSQSNKPVTTTTPTIGYRFHTNSEELGEVQSEQNNLGSANNEKNSEHKVKPTLLMTGSLENSKSDDDKSDGLSDINKDPWNLLARRSLSVDSNYESPFANPIESLRKLNELKGKITKTVEEKMSEMKMDRTLLGKSSRTKLFNSKENSSISDSEDTSESSKLSEQWRDAEDLNLSLKEVIRKNTDLLSSSSEAGLHSYKSDFKTSAELRSRKSCTKISEFVKLSDIKIATAKSGYDSSICDDSIIEDVESGVEADENLDPIDSASVDFTDETYTQLSVGGSQTPPSDGNDIFRGLTNYFSSIFYSQIYTLVFVVGFSLYFFLPMSDFTKGFAFCLLLVAFFESVRTYMRRDESSGHHQRPFIVPDYKLLPPLKVPEYKPIKGVWINEYERELYDPDYYSVTHTVPAYLELDNSILKLSRPKGKVNKRATFDEPEYKLQFVSQRVYNISGCNVYLMPDGLTRKRLFSKKYPIVIFLKPDSLISEKKKEKDSDDKENHETSDVEESGVKPSGSPIKNKSSLYLFARCDRQKEEWYRRLLTAARLSTTSVQKVSTKPLDVEEAQNLNDSPKKEPSTPFESLFFDSDIVLAEEYLQYMARFVNTEVIRHEVKQIKSRDVTWYKKFKTKKKDAPVHEENVEHIGSFTIDPIFKKVKTEQMTGSENQEETDLEEHTSYPCLQVQWFNAFLNRILFDMFRSPYWLSKIHDKLHKKLNSIRLPYYVEDIEVIEMDLGKTGPTFHRVSEPYLDERGLWFDMDTTFDGLIKLTIQTHINLVKLQKGMEEEQALNNACEKPEKAKKKAKEIRDPFLIKESNEKSKESVNRKNKKLEKEREVVSSKLCFADTKVTEHENSSLANDPEVDSKSSEAKLFNEMAQVAKIAIEEGIRRSCQNERGLEVEPSDSTTENRSLKARSPIYDSELEDSAESSDDDIEEEDEVSPLQPPPEPEDQPTPVSIARRYPKNRRSSKKLFRMFESVAQSKYFKSMAQLKYIQKAIAGVSATKLKLTLEIKSCSGTLAVNIPPPPSDRFWYGFRTMPTLCFSANPKIGEKAVKFFQIKNYLQKKILHEIKKVLVVPNMVDFVLPTMTPGRCSSSQQIEQPDPDEQEMTPSD